MAGKKQELSTNRYIVIVTLSSVAIVLICGFIGYSLFKQIVLNTKVAVGKAKAKTALEEKLKNAPILIDNYQKLGSQRDLINHALPNRSDFAALNSVMENESNVAGVKLQMLAPEGTVNIAATTGSSSASSTTTKVTGDKPISYVFTATVEGPYSRVVDFTKQIELSARPMQVTSIKLTGASTDIIAEVVVTTYYQGKADISDKKEPVK